MWCWPRSPVATRRSESLVSRETWEKAARHSGLPITPEQIDHLLRFRVWLLDEGIRNGLIGPREAERIDGRHIADSILFAVALPPGVDEVWDLGSGGGLPGIPLAIVMPGTHFRLIDRSRRRCDLMRRVVRILGLGNVTIEQTEIERLRGSVPALVSRATLTPTETAKVARRLLQPGGVAVMGGSWEEAPVTDEWEVLEIPPTILDHGVWLLMMRPT